MFRAPQDKLDMLQHLLRTALDAGWLQSRALNAMQGNVWFEHSDSSGSVVNMFAVLSTLEKASTSRMNLTRDSHADLNGELKQWLHICLLYTSPSPRDLSTSRMPSSA